jgi:hypothetical protein
MHEQTSWCTVVINQGNADNRANKADIVESNPAIQTIKGIFCINENDCISLIDLENGHHRMNHSLNTRLLAGTHLSNTAGLLHITLNHSHDCFSTNTPTNLTNANRSRPTTTTIITTIITIIITINTTTTTITSATTTIINIRTTTTIIIIINIIISILIGTTPTTTASTAIAAFIAIVLC